MPRHFATYVQQRPIAGYCRYHRTWLTAEKIIEKDCDNKDNVKKLMGYCPYFEMWRAEATR